MSSTKYLYLSFFIVAIISVAYIWSMHISSESKAVWIIAVILAETIILAIMLTHRPDIYPDYLKDAQKQHKFQGLYAHRKGFCFACIPTVIDDVAYIDMLFQSQYERPCHAEISLRPPRGFFLQKSKIESLYYTVDCPPAGFGIARIPIAIPLKNQGKIQSFNTGATVKYPHGKGKRIRFKPGLEITLPATTSDIDSIFRPLLEILPSSGVFNKTVLMELRLPEGVAETLPDEQQMQQGTEIIWQLGDEPLEFGWEAAE